MFVTAFVSSTSPPTGFGRLVNDVAGERKRSAGGIHSFHPGRRAPYLILPVWSGQNAGIAAPTSMPFS